MLIYILCLLILITYVTIIFYLGYIFLKDRKVFNIFLEDIFILYQNVIYFYKNEMDIEMEITMEIDLDNVHILQTLYKLFKDIDKYNLPVGIIRDKYNIYIWFLEYSIKNYEYIKNEKTELYNILKKIYIDNNHLNNNVNVDINNKTYRIEIENLEYLENEIDSIIKINKICNDFIKNYIDKYLFNKNNYRNNYILSFIWDITTWIC